MIELRNITEDNFHDCIHLKASVANESFVDPVVYSLAEAWLDYPNTKPFAIYKGDKLIMYTFFNTDNCFNKIFVICFCHFFNMVSYYYVIHVFSHTIFLYSPRPKNSKTPLSLKNCNCCLIFA